MREKKRVSLILYNSLVIRMQKCYFLQIKIELNGKRYTREEEKKNIYSMKQVSVLLLHKLLNQPNSQVPLVGQSSVHCYYYYFFCHVY